MSGGEPTSARTIGVTGTAVEDTIVTSGGDVEESMGGVYYAVLTLRVLLPEDVGLAPVLRVGRDAEARVRADLGSLPRTTLEGVATVPATNNKVRLVYRAGGERDETLTGGVGPLGWDDLAPWIDRLDAWLWNFIAGDETDRATFGRLKRSFAGPLHLDVHSLCLGRPEEGPRRPRRPPRWEEWVEGTTWMQCNEKEAGMLWEGRWEALPFEEERAFAARVGELGAEGILVSRGERGATWHPTAGEPATEPAVGAASAVDPTGCGDVLGAAWVAMRVGRGLPAADALPAAVTAAGAAATVRGTGDLAETLAGADLASARGGAA